MTRILICLARSGTTNLQTTSAWTTKQPSMQSNPIVIFGEVLFDLFPDGARVLGGAPFNVAWHLQAFGQSPQFISCVGNDSEGQQIRDAMQTWGLSTDFLQQDLVHTTGQVKVSLNNSEPHYEIVADQAYDHITRPSSGNLNRNGILYHGTLALRSSQSKATFRELSASHQGKIFLDVNLRQPWWDKAECLQLLKNVDWLKLNCDEFSGLSDYADGHQPAMEEFITTYELEGIILTCGDQGALALHKDGLFHSVSPNTTTTLADTVGAGDAFCSVILLGLNLGWDFTLMLERAQAFASAVTGIKGATISQTSFYRPFIEDWGADLIGL